MKKSRVFLATAVILVLISAVFVSGAAAKKVAFTGTWYSTDVDGSNQTLKITGGGGGQVHVKYYDDGASVCGVHPGPPVVILFAASAKGMLEVAGNTFGGTLPVICLTTPPTFYADSTFGFTYDPLTDTLTDVHLVVWHR
jgi:hypothetical protein